MGPKPKNTGSGDGTLRAVTPAKARGRDGEGKKPATKRGATSKRGGKGQVDESGSPIAGEEEVERLRVFLKVSPNTGSSSGSSCIGTDTATNTAWSLDFDGGRAGAAIQLDGVFTADQQESDLYAAVSHRHRDSPSLALPHSPLATPHGWLPGHAHR